MKLHRELLDKAIWQKSTVEQKAVLITIMLLANHKENEWEWQGQRFIVQPGQFITSAHSLAEKAGVSRQNVRTALLRFEKYNFLTIQSTKTGSLITIENWGFYQDLTNKPNQQPNHQVTNDQPTPNQHLTTNKNDKNDKNDEEALKTLSVKVPQDEDANMHTCDTNENRQTAIERRFELFWTAYPKKKAKKAAWAAFKKAKPDEALFIRIMDAIGRARTSIDWQKDGGQYIPNPATWLNGGCWDDVYKEATPHGMHSRHTTQNNKQHPGIAATDAGKRDALPGFKTADDDEFYTSNNRTDI